MNRVERAVYDLVKRNPAIKLAVRNVYQRLFDWVPVPPCSTSYPIVSREGFFFGFHDHTPFSADNTALLANRYSIGLRMPKVHDSLEVGVFRGPTFEMWQPMACTHAWNWHQGCKLQWRGSYPEFIYNDYVGGRFISRIHNVDSGSTIDVDQPISSVGSDGRWAVGYSFERVQRYMPGYGYIQPGGEPQLDAQAPERSGLYIVDLATGERRSFVSIAELASFRPEPASESKWHYVSHALFCPSGDRVAFLHRWVSDDVRERQSRLFTCNLDGEDWHLFPTREMVSHIGWRSADEILAYCRLPDGRDRYVLFSDTSGQPLKTIGARVFSSDGHPCFSPDGGWMLTDTYPDRTRRSYLALLELATDNRYDLAHLKSPREFQSALYRHWSCDLHPRFDRTGRWLCFDSAHSGVRALCTIDLGEGGLSRPPRTIRS